MLKKSGFSLFELVIVIGALALLSVIVFISTRPTNRMGEASDVKRNADITAIEQTIKVIITDSGELPDALGDMAEDTPYVIVQTGGSVSGTYSCAALGTSINKIDISSAISSLMPALPVDPDLSKTNNETGYYIIRNGNLFEVDTCDSYRLAATIGSKQSCGDGYCHTNESCVSCPNDCCAQICGDGILSPGEICDDGNTDVEVCGDSTAQSGNYCNTTCSSALYLNEECDDGNAVNTDACLSTCVNASCGDTYCGNGETCAACETDCGACAQQYSSDKYPGTVTDVGGIWAWTNPNNVKVDDGTATYALATPPSTSYVDHTVSIIKSDGSVGSTNYATTGWGSSWAVTTYGDSANKWGETWTPADINSSNFGVALAAESMEENVSNTLKVTNFGFSIPETATIDGIIVYIEKRNRTTTKAPTVSYAELDVIHIKVYYTD